MKSFAAHKSKVQGADRLAVAVRLLGLADNAMSPILAVSTISGDLVQHCLRGPHTVARMDNRKPACLYDIVGLLSSLVTHLELSMYYSSFVYNLSTRNSLKLLKTKPISFQ